MSYSNNPPWLPDLLAILGWQGGTVHQAMDEVRRLKQSRDETLDEAAQVAMESLIANRTHLIPERIRALKRSV